MLCHIKRPPAERAKVVMPSRTDIAINTSSGQPLAVVEVKNIPHLTLAQAVDLRDAMFEHVARPVRYVLVVSQAKGFIWRGDGHAPGWGKPEVLDMRPVLREYLTDAQLDLHIRGAELELVFSHWLGDLARGRVTLPSGVDEQGPFSQFLVDVRHAEIYLEAPA